jgi:hypothetical protein
MKQICSSRPSCTELSNICDRIASLQQHLIMESVKGVRVRVRVRVCVRVCVCVCYKQRAVVECLVADRESVSNINRRLCNVCVRAAGERSTVGRWAISVTVCETGRAELCRLPSSGVPSHIFGLQCEGMMMSSVARIDTSQPDNRRSVLQ